MKKPSDEMRIDETNDLLGMVPGLGFAPPSNKQRMTGGKGPVVDSQMQVENTNKLVESITGGGLKKLNEHGPSKHQGHQPLHSLTESGPWHHGTEVDPTDVYPMLTDMITALENEIQQGKDHARQYPQEKHEMEKAGALLKKTVDHLKAAHTVIGTVY